MRRGRPKKETNLSLKKPRVQSGRFCSKPKHPPAQFKREPACDCLVMRYVNFMAVMFLQEDW